MNVRGGGRGSAGFLEAEHGALPIGNPKEGLANSTMADYLDHEKFGSRISMAEKMNVNFTAQYNQKQVRAYSKLYQDAVKLMNSEDLNAFDIKEATKIICGSARSMGIEVKE